MKIGIKILENDFFQKNWHYFIISNVHIYQDFVFVFVNNHFIGFIS